MCHFAEINDNDAAADDDNDEVPGLQQPFYNHKITL